MPPTDDSARSAARRDPRARSPREHSQPGVDPGVAPAAESDFVRAPDAPAGATPRLAVMPPATPGDSATAAPRGSAEIGTTLEPNPRPAPPRLQTAEMSTLEPQDGLASTAPAAPRSRAPRDSRPRHARYRRGTSIGRYIVLDLLGAGTMGAVYAAYDPELDRRIAVKLLATGQTRSRKARQRLLREARALARLSHPNVIQVHDVGIEGHDVFVAMELVEGESLDTLIQRNPRPPYRDIVQLYLQAARGLAAAHHVGLIHRDFKPSNVLIGRDGRVRVADFGLAAATHPVPGELSLQRAAHDASGRLRKTLAEPDDSPDDSADDSPDDSPDDSRDDSRDGVNDSADDSPDMAQTAPALDSTAAPAGSMFTADAHADTDADTDADDSDLSGDRDSDSDVSGDRDRDVSGDRDRDVSGDRDRDAHADTDAADAIDDTSAREARYTAFGSTLEAADSADSGPTPMPERTQPAAPPMRAGLDDHITDPGTIMGTPAFMAPEQHSGDEVGPQADQYSFCVALYAGLYGLLPFQPPPDSKRPMVALLRRKQREELVPPLPGHDIPDWLHQVTTRGLAADPARRWPSIQALIEALEDDPEARRRRARRRIAAGSMVLVLIGLAAFGWLRPAALPPPTCHDAEQQLAGIWDPQVKAETRLAFLGTGRSYAAPIHDRVSDILDQYTRDWAAMRVETCEATRVRQEQSEKTLDLRMYCLSQRRSRLQALSELLKSRDIGPAVVDNSVQAALALPEIAYCADIEALTAAVPPPATPALRAQVSAQQTHLDRAETLRQGAGEYRAALAIATEVLHKSTAIPYPRLRAQAILKVAQLERQTGAPEAAEPHLQEAIVAAAKARDAKLEAEAWIELLWNVGYVQGRYRDAGELVLPTEAAVEHADDELIRAEFWLTRGAIMYSTGEHAAAAEYEAQALAAQEQVLGRDDPTIAQSMNNLAVSLMELGDYERAEPLLRQALDLRERVLSPNHPQVAQSLTNLAKALAERGQFAAAESMHARSLDIYRDALGESHWLFAYALDAKAHTLLRKGAYERARVSFEQALGIFERDGDGDGDSSADNPHAAASLLGLGQVLTAQAEPEQAIPLLERALRIAEHGHHHTLAEVRFALAEALWYAERERSRALELAHLSEQFFAGIGHAERHAEIERWLAERPTPP